MNENEEKPGVSGKERNKKPWINIDKYHEQIHMIHDVHAREEQILEELKKSPEVDVAAIDVSVDGGSVILRGEADDPNESRAMENIVKNIPGVDEVINKLKVKSGKDLPHH